MADLIPFPRVIPEAPGYRWNEEHVAEVAQALAERREPCRATSDYLNRPCRSPAELEAMLRAQGDTTAARESV